MGNVVGTVEGFVGNKVFNGVIKPFFATCWDFIAAGGRRAISFMNNDSTLKQQKAICDERIKCASCDCGYLIRFVFQPCGHMCCVGCNNTLQKCWKCDEQVIARLYMSYDYN